ncbi:MAG: dephospho-CoA kinase [Verrucomicrobiae bacterium]|nr:dephospho-CoA kinase [Verrucomicrobiae bacterium]
MTPNVSSRPLHVCLTGGIATGKSRVARWFTDRGWTTICADEIVHEFYRPGQPVAAAVTKEFGAEVLAADGSVDRARLGRIVFGDRARLARLNALVHPPVREAWRARAAAVEGRPVMVIVPLAYEAEAAEEFARVWVVACSARTQKARLEERGLNREDVAKRVAAQLPLQTKMDRADRVVWNDGPWKTTVEQIARIEREERREAAR